MNCVRSANYRGHSEGHRCDQFVEDRPLLISRFPLYGSVRRKYLRGTQQLPTAAHEACRIVADRTPQVLQLPLVVLIHGGCHEV